MTFGFYVKNGVLHECGNRVNEIGVNSLDAFIDYGNCTEDKPCVYQKPERYTLLFKRMRSKGMRVMRTMLLGLCPNTYKHIRANHEEYFSKLDAFIKAAEENGIRLVASVIFSQVQIPPTVGETINKIGVTGSRTQNELKMIITRIVSRYKNSPAIAIWEAMNEHDLRINITPDYLINESMGYPAEWTEKDTLTLQQAVNFNTFFHKLVRSIDSDPAYPNESQRATATGGAGWQPYNDNDSSTNFEKYWSLRMQTEVTDMMSFHPYAQGNTDGENSLGPYSGLFDFQNYKSFIEKISSRARQSGKAAYIGEIGMSTKIKTYADGDATLISQIRACVEGGAQLILLWQWCANDDTDPQQGFSYPAYEKSNRLRVLDSVLGIKYGSNQISLMPASYSTQKK